MKIDTKIIRAFQPTSKIVVLSGAGLSKESGIPTFRDAQEGLWAKFDPEELASPRGFAKNPQLVMDWYNWRRKMVLSSEPNAAHKALARWQSRFPNLTLVTQNVDGLHQKAGSQKVIEMHGSIHRMKCQANAHLNEWVALEGSLARCPECDSLLRPDIVWFGEYILPGHLDLIDKAVRACEIFIAIGTSGLVYPAAGFLAQAKSNSAMTIAINPDPTARGDAEFFLQGSASDALNSMTQKIMPP